MRALATRSRMPLAHSRKKGALLMGPNLSGQDPKWTARLLLQEWSVSGGGPNLQFASVSLLCSERKYEKELWTGRRAIGRGQRTQIDFYTTIHTCQQSKKLFLAMPKAKCVLMGEGTGVQTTGNDFRLQKMHLWPLCCRYIHRQGEEIKEGCIISR